MLLFLIVGRQRIGSFGFAKGRFVCWAKPNVPIVRWQKNKKMRVGKKLNLSGSDCVSSCYILCLSVSSLSLYFFFLTSLYQGCSVFLPLLTTVGGMKSCRLRAISCQVTQKLKRATNLE